MPALPSQWASNSDAVISASRLNYDMYTYTSNQFNPTGVHFHTFRPLFWELLNASQGYAQTGGSGAYVNLSQQTGTTYPVGVTCYDTAGLWGAGADYIQGQYQFLPTVPGSDGSPGTNVGPDAGGYYVLAHFVDMNGAAAADILGASMNAESSGNPLTGTGGRQWRSTTQKACAYHLDLVPTGTNAPSGWNSPGTEFSPSAYLNQSSNFTYNPSAVSSSATDTGAGEVCRFFGWWQAINNGTGWGNQNTPGTIKSSWPVGTNVTSTIMQNALAQPLTFLGNPPSFRGGGFPGTTTVATATNTVVPLTNSATTYNGLTNWNSGTSTYTIPVAGMYLVHGTVSYTLAASAGNSARAGVKINSNYYFGPSYQFAASGTMNVCPQKTQIFSLQAGDTVQLATVQQTGSGQSLASGVESHLVVCWLGSNGATFGGSIGSPVTTYASGYVGPPDTSFRWQAGTPGSTLQSQFQTHLGDDMTFLFNRPYFMGYQTVAQTGNATGVFSSNMKYDTLQGIVHGDAGDPWGGWNATNSRWFAPVTGWYLVVHESRLGETTVPPGGTVLDCAAGLTATPTQGGVAPSVTPDWYQHIDVSSNAGNFPGAAAIGLYYLVAGQEAVSSQFMAHTSADSPQTMVGNTAPTFNGPSHMEVIWLGK